jgi:hypothetical protein
MLFTWTVEKRNRKIKLKKKYGVITRPCLVVAFVFYNKSIWCLDVKNWWCNLLSERDEKLKVIKSTTKH